MALLFYSASDDPAEWRELLAAELPGREVRVWPEVGDPDEIDYALLWKAPPGLIAPCRRVKVVFALGAGVDPVLADPAIPRDVPVVRLVEAGLTQGMVEYVLLHVLAWHRNLYTYRYLQQRGAWRQLAERLAPERRVGLLGLGVLGQAAARALQAVGFEVAGWSRTPKRLDGIASFAGAAGLDELLARSEILVCLLPLTPETRGILNRETFAALPKEAVVINAARGGHLVERNLLEALDSGHIAAATLDVFETEPLPPDHAFWQHPKVTVTPHVAAATHARSAAGSVIRQMERYEAGLPLENVVNLAKGY